MKKNIKIILPLLGFITLSLCGCESSYLYGEDNKTLSKKEISKIEKDVLNNRQFAKSVDKKYVQKQIEVSSTVHLNPKLENITNSETVEVFSNFAISKKGKKENAITITATGFTTLDQYETINYSWLSQIDDMTPSYKHYYYTQSTYNKGSNYISYDESDNLISADETSSYWGVKKYNALFFENIDFYTLFSNDDYNFIKSDGDSVIAFNASNKKLTYLANPLYPEDKSRKLPILNIDSNSFTFKNINGFGYVLSQIEIVKQENLLENFNNKYYSSPKTILDQKLVYSYQYSKELSTFDIPNINESVSSSLTPILSKYDTDGNFISCTNKSDCVDITSVYRKNDSSFKGYAFILPFQTKEDDVTYSLTTFAQINREKKG